MGYNTTAIVTTDQSAPPPPTPKLDSTAFDTTVKQQEGVWDWDRGPSVSRSADILFLREALFDISFEKLLDATFAYNTEMHKENTDVM